jgi:hypothetical protein
LPDRGHSCPFSSSDRTVEERKVPIVRFDLINPVTNQSRCFSYGAAALIYLRTVTGKATPSASVNGKRVASIAYAAVVIPKPPQGKEIRVAATVR